MSDTTTVLKSVCRSCHGGCGVLLHVRDDRLVKVEGDRESPLNHGRLCPIGTCTLDIVYHPDRLKYPLRRVGARGAGQWKRISWDQALDEISRRLLAIREEFGPEAIAFGTGTGRHHIRWVSRFGARARHAELVRAGVRAVLSSPRQHLHFDVRRLPGVGLYRRRCARVHHVLGPQSDLFGSGR